MASAKPSFCVELNGRRVRYFTLRVRQRSVSDTESGSFSRVPSKADGLLSGEMDEIMKPDDAPSYGKWSRDELSKAEATASQFLEQNATQIAETMRVKLRFLETLIQRIALKNTSFEDRLEYFARVSEIARMLEVDADGFFELASQPVVARILGTVPPKRAA
jgi:hypothetical protein